MNLGERKSPSRAPDIREARLYTLLERCENALADLFSILLSPCNLVQEGFHFLLGQPLHHRLGFLQIRRDPEAFAIDACQRFL